MLFVGSAGLCVRNLSRLCSVVSLDLNLAAERVLQGVHPVGKVNAALSDPREGTLARNLGNALLAKDADRTSLTNEALLDLEREVNSLREVPKGVGRIGVPTGFLLAVVSMMLDAGAPFADTALLFLGAVTFGVAASVFARATFGEADRKGKELFRAVDRWVQLCEETDSEARTCEGVGRA